MRRSKLIFAVVALVVAFALTRGLVAQPGFTDAFYHFNAANRLVHGDGLTDPYLWTYIGAPDHLPAPSHLYWMPLTSLIAAAGMALLGSTYAAAQFPFTLMYAATAGVGFYLGGRIGGGRRHAWMAGLLTLFSGYYARFWGATDTFAPYALVGSLCLLMLGLAVERLSASRRPYALCMAAGALAALAHLTRADGVLLLLVGWIVILWPRLNALTPFPWFGPLALRVEDAASRRERGHNHLGSPSGRGETEKPAGRFTMPSHELRDANHSQGVVTTPPSLLAERGAAGQVGFRVRLTCIMLMTLAYLVVMAPWFIRNQTVIGTPLPVGGTQGIWFAEYNDLFDYPPDSTLSTFLATGLPHILATRWEALSNNLLRFVAEQGLIVMTPLMLLGLWMRRRQPLLRAFWLYALGLFVAMTFIFAFPGYRGGLFHSAAALVPWWAALGVAGLDQAVDWVARRRRRWDAATAKWFFSVALLFVAVFLSLSIGLGGRVSAGEPPLYAALAAKLPADARVMINDPAALYYFTGRGGVVLPNETPDVIPTIARQYGVGYLLLETPSATPSLLWPLFESTPSFLTPIPLDIPGVRLYAFAAS